ncbi:Putative DNA repair photolyase [Elusimicrobium minutum Pei191]|uniref:Putative DNA repair photolyase n=1 Tax=Elusimicrobium minutum (strain Pei191) TaxID=445932 RepID=B2KDI7_ELUMP|nr:radical SAM protein [Elusimicrobium minutum]ACC98583.1 Putative DNA repair photolyase [Elusimicrobium minutum Pei191]
MKYIPAKTLITKVKPSLFWFATDYNMNIYRGCSHGCIYCDSRSQCYRIENFDEVRAKEDAVAKISFELSRKRQKGLIASGAMSDPYNPQESKHNLTRNALKEIDRYGFGLALATKSPLVTRDIDIIKSICTRSSVIIKITITCAQDSLSKQIEPNVSPSSERFAALKQLSDNGIFCGVLLMPVLPFINDTEDNILSIVRQTAAAGAKFIYSYFGVTLRDNQRDYFYNKIADLFPYAKEKYITAFGESYSCQSPKTNQLTRAFKKECDKFGILYNMKDIIAAYKKPQEIKEQLELF